MRALAAILLFAVSALAGDPPKLSDALLKERWKAIAIHQSNAARELQLQMELQKSKAEYDRVMSEIRKACGDKHQVDDSGPEVVCAPLPKK